MLLPTRGNFLEVTPQIDIHWRFIRLPEHKVILTKITEPQLRKIKAHARCILETEKLTALPLRNCCNQAMSQGVELHVGILKQLIGETAVVSQAGHRNVPA